MVTLIQLADVGARQAVRVLRRSPRPDRVPGLHWAQATTLAPLGGGLMPSPRPGRVGLISTWGDDAAVDAYLAEHELVPVLESGWRARLDLARVVGSWPAFDDAPCVESSFEGPVAVLTLGQLRPTRAVAFLRASARAEQGALESSALLMSTAMAKPPGLVATFSLWSDIGAMRAYATERDGGHRHATDVHAARPLHSQAAFLRFQVRDEHGSWDARRSAEPVASIAA